MGLVTSLIWPVINSLYGSLSIGGDTMANKNQYKGPSKTESAFVKGVKAAQRRKERRDNLDKLRAQEALANKKKKRKK